MKFRVYKDYLLLLKLAGLIFCTYNYFYSDQFNIYGDGKSIVIVFLIYICLNIGAYMIKSSWRIALNVVTIIFLIYCVLRIEGIIGILIPLNIYDISFRNKEINILVYISIIIFSFIIPVKYISQYLLFSLCGFIIYFLIENYVKKLNKILIENDNLREINSKLKHKLEKRNRYEKQIVYTSQLEERNAIAQQMHDKLGHTLAGGLMQLQAIKFIMDSDREKAGKLLDGTIEVLRIGMDDIRMTLRKIAPPKEVLGINRIKLILEEGVNGTGFNSTVAFNGDLNIISYEQWKVVGESLREFITNSIKYSGGNNITVNIFILNKLIKIEIKDNGKGFKTLKKGMGIVGIEQRIMDLGGKAIIDGNRGFSLMILLPITK